ncbi:hypothetical protein [Peribacillus simplex]|uniref:hypothetical protein n=1 Tax=Peribacillus simplex TaxID=1478 RepID=UPI00366D63A7
MNPKGRQKVKHLKAVPEKIMINAKRASLLDFWESEQKSPRLFLRSLTKFRLSRGLYRELQPLTFNNVAVNLFISGREGGDKKFPEIFVSLS